MAAQPKVSIIIANWNGRNWLEGCLPALQNQTYQNFEIIVVDNGSTDNSIAWLEKNWSQVLILPQNQNTGFAKANNIGIEASVSTFVVTLNNDTRPHTTWLSELVDVATSLDCGMVASCILQWNNPTLLDSAGIEVDNAGIAWQRCWNQPASSAATSLTVFGPSAAAALYRRSMLAEIGLFDADYFAYYEDVDLAWRAQLAGWSCQYAPKAKVAHWHSATAANISDRKLYYISRNKIWTLFKNLSTTHLLRTLPLILIYDFMAAAYQTNHTRRLTALRGRIDAVRQREVALAKRPSNVPAIPLAPLPSPWQLLLRKQPKR